MAHKEFHSKKVGETVYFFTFFQHQHSMLVFLFSVLSLSWAGETHLMIARIAQKMLTPSQQQWMDEIMAYWPSEKQTMVEASNWQDSLRSDVGDIFLEWHFSDIPIVEPGFESHVPNAHFNITDALKDEMRGIMDKTTTSMWAIAFNLRNIIHFVGDSHCPVHAVTHFSEEFPDGDMGANSVVLDCDQYGYYCANLHKVWDSAVVNYITPKGRAQSMPDFESNITKVEKIARVAPLNETLNDYSPDKWVAESHEIAVNFVYDQYLEPSLNERYINEGREQSNIRISVAGNRLGLILRQFFETRTDLNFTRILSSSSASSDKETKTKMPTAEFCVWIIDAIAIVVVIIYSAIFLYQRRIASKLSNAPLLTNSIESIIA